MFDFRNALFRLFGGVVLALGALPFPAVPALGAPESPESVRIGVLANRGPQLCLAKWGLTAKYLTSEIPGHSFTIVPLDFDDIAPTVERGDVDFMLTNPSFYVGLEKLYGANRIATLKNRRMAGVYTVFGGVIFHRADREDIQDLGDLKGMTFMAVKETSFGGWQMAWRELKKRRIDPHSDFADFRFGGTHDAVVYAVRDGRVDAGTVRTDALERMCEEGEIRLEDFRVLGHDHIGEEVCEFPLLHSTDTYPEWPMAELAHTSNELAERVAVALVGMPADSPAAKAARCAGWTVPLNYQPVHECLKELRVGPYKDYGKVTADDVLRQYWPWLLAGFAALIWLVLVVVYTRQLNRKLARAVSAEERRAHQQVVVAGFGQIALSAASLDELLDKAVVLISQTLGTKYAEVLEHVPEQQVLFLRAGVGWKEGWVRHKSVPDGPNSQGGYTLLQDKPVIAEDIHNEARFAPPALLTEHNAVGGMTVAIPGHDRPFGILGVHTDRMQTFSQNDAHFLEAVANVLAGAIQQRDAQEELRETRDYLENLIECASAPIIVWDPTSRITTFNRAFEHLTDYAADEVVGREFSLLFPESSREESMSEIARAVGGEHWESVDIPIRRKTGETRSVLWNSANVYSQDGATLLATVAQGVDITERKRAEEDLRESEGRFRDIAENALEWIWEVDADGKYTYASPVVDKILGYKSEEVLEKHFYDLFHPEDREETKKAAFEVFARRQPFRGFINRNVHRNGRTVWLSTSGVSIFDERGKFLGYRGVDIDITERKRAEEALRESERHHRRIFESTTDAMLIFDPEGMIVEANPAACAVYGYEYEELTGLSGKHIVHPDYYHLFEKFKAQLKAEGKFYAESVDVRKDGTTFDIEVRGTNVALRGKPHLLAIVSDITERKFAERALRESEEFASSLLSNAPNPIIVINPDTSIRYVNAALEKMSGYSSAEVVGRKPPYPWWAEETLKEIVGRFRETLQKGAHQLEEFFQRKNGERFWVEITSTPVTREGEMKYYVENWVDITERKRGEQERAVLQEQLHQAQKMEAIGQLADGVAHDFNNLLAAITGYSSLAKTTIPKDHEAIKLLEGVEEAAEQAGGVTNSLLTFSQKTVTEKAPVELRGLVEKSVRLLRRVLPAGVELVADTAGEAAVWVRADRTQMQQIVLNLAINARDAMPDCGTLRVSVSRMPTDRRESAASAGSRTFALAPGCEGPVARLVVSDTGTGMSPEVQARIFEPFFTTKPRGQGTGLGLAIIHGIVKDHGGRIEVESEPARGTTFTVVLPSLEKEAIPQVVKSPSAPPTGRGELILLAEDNRHLRSIILSALDSLGYEVVPAGDGNSLMECFERHRTRVRLLVIDIDFPKRSVVDCLRDIRAGGFQTPAIIITGVVDTDLESQLDEDTLLLHKPFQISDLGALVGNVLGAQGDREDQA